MICQMCRLGADLADDYRAADREWRAQHPADAPAAGPQWLLRRLKMARAMHCKGKTCNTCQHRIPELEAAS